GGLTELQRESITLAYYGGRREPPGGPTPRAARGPRQTPGPGGGGRGGGGGGGRGWGGGGATPPRARAGAGARPAAARRRAARTRGPLWAVATRGRGGGGSWGRSRPTGRGPPRCSPRQPCARRCLPPCGGPASCRP